MRREASYYQIYRLITGTRYGRILVKNVRFGRFKPDTVSPQKWEQVLGADVNNLRHMWFTKKLTDQFLAYSGSGYTDEEAHLLRLTATFHDLAESITGDIPKPLKTVNDETTEKDVLTRLIHELCDKNPSLRQSRDELLYCVNTILFPDSPNRLSETFMVIEFTGYLHTACRAWKVAQQSKRATPLSTGLQALAEEVIPNSTAKLEKHAPRYTAISAFFQTDLIREAIDGMYGAAPFRGEIEPAFATA